MTQVQACSKFSQLQSSPEAVFDQLKAEQRCFAINGIDYFWLPELEALLKGQKLDVVVGGGAMSSARSGLLSSSATAANSFRKRSVPATDENVGPNKRRRQEVSRPFLFSDSHDSAKTPADRNSTGTAVWRYRVISDKKVGIRIGPDVQSEPSPSGHLRPGALVYVSERKKGSDGRWYFRLANGSGWTYDRSAKDLSKIVMREALPNEQVDDLMWHQKDER